jgi:NADH dehydrogenase
VATGGLNPEDVTYALRTFAARFGKRTVSPRVRAPGGRRPALRPRRHGEEIGYDYLVVCCGVTANYFGIPGAEEHARAIYTRGAAIEVRGVLLGNLEAVA